MRDEEYVYRQGVKEAASIARNARYRRTHNGKSGRVRFPSDYLTNKEKNAMNGEVKSYRLNDPVKWDEFKAMPDDIKITYIKLLRERFGVPDAYIGMMLGVAQRTISLYLTGLGCSAGKGKNSPKWDKEGFLAWCNGAPAPIADAVEETQEEAEEPVEVEATEPEPICEEKKKAIPNTGTMTFEGSTESILETLAVLLGGANVHIGVTWDVLSGD